MVCFSTIVDELTGSNHCMFIPDKKIQNPQNLLFLSNQKLPKAYSKKNQLISSLIQTVFRSIQDLRFNDKTALLKNKRSNRFMVAELSIKEDSKDGVHILYVGGRLDVTSAPILEKRLMPLVETPQAKVVINFGDLGYLSSAGLRVMLYAHKRLKSIKGQLAFCCIKPPVMEILQLAGFESILSIYQKEFEALKALKIKEADD